MDGDGNTADLASTADRNKDHVHIGHILSDFQTEGTHTCDEIGLVGRVKVAVALLSGRCLIANTGFVEIPAVKNHLGAAWPPTCRDCFLMVPGLRDGADDVNRSLRHSVNLYHTDSMLSSGRYSLVFADTGPLGQ
jgi:hypothetical protein